MFQRNARGSVLIMKWFISECMGFRMFLLTIEGIWPFPCYLVVGTDVPEGCVIIREHNLITNLFTCLWFNEVDRFTSRDQLSFAIVRNKLTEKVDWGFSMFLDCERRNFVVQVCTWNCVCVFWDLGGISGTCIIILNQGLLLICLCL